MQFCKNVNFSNPDFSCFFFVVFFYVNVRLFFSSNLFSCHVAYLKHELEPQIKARKIIWINKRISILKICGLICNIESVMMYPDSFEKKDCFKAM